MSWQRLEEDRQLHEFLQDVIKVNSIYAGTVSTWQLGSVVESAESIKQRIDLFMLESSGGNSQTLRVAVELDTYFDCDWVQCINCTDIENEVSYLANITTVEVNVQARGSVDDPISGLFECQKHLETSKNLTNTRLVPIGSNSFKMDYRDDQLMISCGQNEESLCSRLEDVNNDMINDNTSFLIYQLNTSHHGILEHPKRIICGTQNMNQKLWTETGLNEKMGFSIFYDSQSVEYTSSMLFEIAKTAPNLVVENRFPLNSTSEEAFGKFTDTFVQMMETYMTELKISIRDENFALKSVLFRISLSFQLAFEAPFPEELYRWARLAENACSKINSVWPHLVQGVIFREDVRVTPAPGNYSGYRPIPWLDKALELKEKLDWKPELKLGIQNNRFSSPHQYTGQNYDCPDWLNGSLRFDSTFLDFEVNLREQCLSAYQPVIKEEAFGYLFQCDYSKDYLATFPENRLAIFVQIIGCNQNKDPSEEEDAQYELVIERLNKLSALYNIHIYVGFAVQESYAYGGHFQESCGWWQVKTNDTGFTHLEARRPRVEEATESPPYDGSDEKGGKEVKWWWIFLPVFAVCVISAGITICQVVRYRSKHLLLNEEIKSLFEGQVISGEHNNDIENVEALSSKYDKEKLEVQKDEFSIESETTLGSGAFGTVHLGTLKQGYVTITVAIKTTKQSSRIPQHADLVALRGLISEIKLLSYIGEHNNIVRLLGAYTGKIRRAYVAVFLEYCSNGSLLDFLRKYKLKSLRNSDLSTGSFTLTSEIKENMLRWTYEIVCGMEYLASKKVIHADLAARNVLLDSNYVSKIADFGLSRRLYSYTNYVKSQQEPLPWRWMAPEALQNLVFNEKTDVWAYGVTLWEIFTLGEVPYLSLIWNDTFPNKLVTGLRLPKPSNASREMYSLMKECWCNHPDSRPTFASIKLELEDNLATEESTDNSDKESDTQSVSEVRDGYSELFFGD